MSKYTKCQISVYQVSNDGGITWEDVTPFTFVRSGVRIPNSEDCGYVPIEPMYRWYQYPISERYDCDYATYTKYQIAVEQVSYDGGITWNDSSPYNYRRSGETIANSEDCGYTPLQGCKVDVYFTNGTQRTDTFDDCVIPSGEYNSIDNMKEAFIYKGITSIDSNAFWGCSGLTSVTIPDSVEYIDDYAFQFCYKLKSITIPDSVEYIGQQAFYRCSGLTNAIIGNGVDSIFDEAFYECTSLTSVTIGNSVTDIGNRAFSRCSSLTSVTIPDSVVTIGEQAFTGCTSLKKLIMDGRVETIGRQAFSDCSGLAYVTIDSKYIGELAFSDCSGLTDVYLSSGVETIGAYAFQNCRKLTSVRIPNSVTDIGYWAFYRCTSLSYIDYDEGTKAQFTAITKDGDWKPFVPSSCIVRCTDGDYPITDF